MKLKLTGTGAESVDRGLRQSVELEWVGDNTYIRTMSAILRAWGNLACERLRARLRFRCSARLLCVYCILISVEVRADSVRLWSGSC